MDGLFPVLGTILLALSALFFARKIKKKEKEKEIPLENIVASAARQTVQQTFKEEIEGIKKDTEGSDPSGDLADRGNARSRK